jgi:hypothetical protein
MFFIQIKSSRSKIAEMFLVFRVFKKHFLLRINRFIIKLSAEVRGYFAEIKR